MDKEIKSVQGRHKAMRDKANQSGKVTDALEDHFYIHFGYKYPVKWYK